MIADHHLALLRDAAIDQAVAEAAGVATITAPTELPEGVEWVKAVPGLAHYYRPDRQWIASPRPCARDHHGARGWRDCAGD